MFVLLLLLLPEVRADVPTPSSLLNPRNFNHHPFEAVKFVKSRPSKNGPILFPNDAPPPPPTPLIVTSRPLIESIARSELNPNNTQTAQSQLNHVSYVPQYLRRVSNYKPYAYLSSTPVYPFVSTPAPFPDTKRFQGVRDDHFYTDYEQRFKTQSRYGKQEQTPDYAHYDVKDRDSSKDYHHGDNYAFSYTVKDRKTGDDFSHSQQSTGSATNGEYRVRLPDGRMQIVSYTADENGYKADVRYDGHHDNSIDAPETSRERFQSKHPSGDTRIRYNDADIHSHEFPTNQEYPINDRTYTNYELKRPTIVEHKGHNSNQVSVNDFSENNDYIDPSNEGPNEAKSGGLTEHNNEYLEHYIERNALSNEKIDRAHDTDYFHYAEEIPFSKEIKDYSSESNVGYQPHKSKFSVYDDDKSSKSSVKPSYEELKRLFVTNYRRRVPDLTSFVSTLKPNYETTTEKVVVISPKKSNLYTNIRDIVSVTPAPLPYSTPSSYLVSTIANLKSKVNLISRPTLSNQFIEKINKYLTYK
ncbi:uncharacterized protein LOC113505168 isoform X2 [Trichoplusia ni]|uniref:Uncharacterized protein LOC113505168 isoform X2 n=1 Tax=Trichoplusia ni TaxID=7111 RepID=A0A7E5WSI7_TRINI|nr:uncharacterized protein LOC113505168 isoform X2 [Trichoplusia ni]